MIRPTAEDLGLCPMPLDEFRATRGAVVARMMDVACEMTNYSSHYDSVFVGACGALVLPELQIVRFSGGPNDKPSPDVPKDCAERKPLRDADALRIEHGRVVIEDLCTATPIGMDRIEEISGDTEMMEAVLGEDLATLYPCHGCLVELSKHHAILPNTNVHTRRITDGRPVDRSREVAALLPILDWVKRPPTSDELVRRGLWNRAA